MTRLLSLLCFCLFLFANSPIYGQNDSITHKDTSIYKKIRHYAEKRRVTKWIYEGIFREVQSPVINVKPGKTKTIIQNPIERYTGKTIAHIKIISEDPFGTSINDTVCRPGNWLEQGANYLHISTWAFTIRQQLLFKQGEMLDPLKISESERLLRQASYANDAKITINSFGNGDSVDAIVVVRDKWSISVNADATASSGSVTVYEDNLLGLGHQLQNGFIYPISSQTPGYFNGKYTINNIGRSYVNAITSFDNNPNHNVQEINIGRGFYSTLTKWAGGLDLAQYKSQYISNNAAFPLNYNTEDFWLGRSIAIGKKSMAGRSTSIVFAGRVANTTYTDRPPYSVDSTNTIQNSKLYLGSIGFSTRHYYKDRNIYHFGVTEDVPEGRLLSFTGGYEQRQFNPRYYTGIRFALGNHITSGGYFSWALEYGTYIENGYSKSGVVNTSATWFSDLLYLGRWSTRQFIYYKGVFGIDRQIGELVNLSGSQGLLGFNSDVLGSSKLALNLQSVVYTPLDLIGFKFSVVLFAGYGSSGNSYNGLFASKIYQLYGIGLLVRNENLVIRTFSLSFGFYPNSPEGNSPFKFNPINSFNVNFQGFSVGEPSQTAYQ